MRSLKQYFLFLVILFIPKIITASNYKVDSYDITINVSEKREYSYEENMNLLFDEQNVYIEKEFSKDIKDLKVNTNYIAETKNKKTIKINSGNNSSYTYTFSYKYNDEKYDNNIYEIKIPNTLNNNINNASFYIILEEDFHKRNVDIYLNGKKRDDIEYKVSKNKIEGTIKELKKNDVITIRIDYSKIYLTPTTAIATIIPILFTIVSVVLWIIYGKDLKYKISKSSNLPKNMNSLELGLIDKGYSDEKDAFCLLIELSNKGYIKIIEKDNNDYILKRVKDYDGKNYKESLFIKSLFRKSSSISLTDYINIISERKKEKNITLDNNIKSDELYQRFQKAKNVILPISNENEEKNKYFEKTSERKKAYLIIIVATILILLTSVPFIEINKLYLLPISVLFSIITLYLLINIVEHTEFKINKKSVYIIAALAIFILIIMLLPAFRRNRIYIITFIICSICIGIIMFLYKYMPKRTIFGTKLYAQIESYKNFITSSSKSEYEQEIAKNDNYLYDNLPLCYVLNLEKEIYHHMKEFDIKEPKWFELKNDFTIQKFSNSVERLYKLLQEKHED